MTSPQFWPVPPAPGTSAASRPKWQAFFAGRRGSEQAEGKARGARLRATGAADNESVIRRDRSGGREGDSQ
jgi:hypothetical protein